MHWSLLSKEEAMTQWDAELKSFCAFGVDQLFAWGEYRRKFGWTPIRLICKSQSNETVAMVQALYRSYPMGIRLIWCGGGPVGQVENWPDGLGEALLKYSGGKLAYCRIFSYWNE